MLSAVCAALCQCVALPVFAVEYVGGDAADMANAAAARAAGGALSVLP